MSEEVPPLPQGHAAFRPQGMYAPASYDHARRAGDTLYLAGQVARDAEGQLLAPGDAARQAAQVYANLGRVLQAAGAGPEHVVKVTTYLVDAADAAAVSAERTRFFAPHRPPHTGLVVAALGQPEVRVEVEAVAVILP